MCGGQSYFNVYFDPTNDVHVRVNYHFYPKLSEETKKLLSTLVQVESHIKECVSSTQQEAGNLHCVRYTYPNAIRIPKYKKLLKAVSLS